MKYCSFFVRTGLLLSIIGLWQDVAYSANRCEAVRPSRIIVDDRYNYRTIDSQLPKNQPMSEWITSYDPSYSKCTFDRNWSLNFLPNDLNATESRYEGHTLFDTSVKGVGYIIEAKAWKATDPEPAWVKIDTTTTDKILNRFPASSNTTIKGALRIRYIKTSDTLPLSFKFKAGDTSITSGFCTSEGNEQPRHIPFELYAAFNTTGGCTTSFPANIILGSHSSKELSKPGKTTADTPFTISISNCTADVTPKLVVNGTSDPYSNKKNVLQLDNPNDPTTAKGVGIELTYDPIGGKANSPVDLNTDLNPSSPLKKGKSITLPFHAHYIRNNASTLEPGQANATATFFVKYS